VAAIRAVPSPRSFVCELGNWKRREAIDGRIRIHTRRVFELPQSAPVTEVMIVSFRKSLRGLSRVSGPFALGSALSVAVMLSAGFANAQEDPDQARKARFWDQLTTLLMPVEMPLMTDHRAFMTPSGVVMALHFDNMDLSQAQNLNWAVIGLPGTFCASEQARVEAALGPGVTHFHDMVNDIHGGAPGAQGVWFVHNAVRDFEAPWGPVAGGGADMGFMPTPAPDC
jgi:hypothetical protein